MADENNIIIKINHLMCIGISIWHITPYLSRNGHPTILVAMLMVWFSTALISMGSYTVNTRALSGVILWLALILIYRIVGYSTCAWGNLYVQIIYWLIFIMYLFYHDRGDTKFLNTLANILMLAMAVNIASNIKLCIDTPDISTVINTIYGDKYLKTNAGATAFSYLTALYIMGLHAKIRQPETKRGMKTLCILFIAGSLFYIVLAGRGTTTILLFLYFVMSTINGFADGRKNKQIIVVLMGAAIVAAVYFSLPLIVDSLSSAFPESRPVGKISEACDILYGKELSSQGSGSSRIELSTLSLKTWTKDAQTILVGIGDHRSKTLSGNYNLGIGNHSEFFDLFARYGLIGAILFGGLFYSSIRKKKPMSDGNFILIINLFAYGFINSITKYPSMAVMIYLFCFNYLEGEKKS